MIFTDIEHEFLRAVPFPMNEPLMNGKIQLQIKTKKWENKINRDFTISI